MKRRQLLLATSPLLVGTAGCTGKSISEQQDTPHRKELVLAYVKISNHHSEPHAVDVLVEKDGDVFRWDTYEVAQFNVDSSAAGITWVRQRHTGIRGKWSVAARLRSKSTGSKVNLVEYPYPDKSCVGIVVRITEDGGIRFVDDVTDCKEWKRTE